MAAIFLINSFLVAAAVLIHYEVLYLLTRLIPRLTFIKPRYRVVMGICGTICAHVIEIWLFAFGYYFVIHYGSLGRLQGNFQGSLMDCIYFSLTNYTSLGFGDIEPIGELRFMAGFEALTGLVLIAWTASFMFFEMQRLWGGK